MIFAHSIISGYICLQGSFVFHIPMLIAMVQFVSVPPLDVRKEAFPGEEIYVMYWYWFAVGLHGVLAFNHLSGLCGGREAWPTAYLSC